MLPKITEPRAVGQAPVDERGGRVRQQDLAAMTGRHDPRSPIDGRPKVVTATRLGIAGVNSHPDADHARLRPRLGEESMLGSDACGDGIDRGCEDRHQAVACGLYDLAVRLRDRGAEDDLVAGESRPHQLRVLLPETRAALDVGEEERRRRGGRRRGPRLDYRLRD